MVLGTKDLKGLNIYCLGTKLYTHGIYLLLSHTKLAYQPKQLLSYF